MKKDKKKGASKKTWVVDCRTDSAFDFALRVLKEVDNSAADYPLNMRLNFIKIAYNNSCEAIAKAQTDPYQYKMKSAFKLFTRNLKCIFEVCSTRFTGYEEIVNYSNILVNPFDYVEINYDTIEDSLNNLRRVSILSNYDNSDDDESLACWRDSALKSINSSVERFGYPKIYEKAIPFNDESTPVAKILPTNDIIVYIPYKVINIFNNANVEKYYSSDDTPHHHTTVDYNLLLNGTSDIIPKPQLIHTPFDSFEHLSNLISVAASCPDRVDEICITAYRLGKESSIIDSIIEASNNGIKCKLYLELSARGESDQDLIYLKKLIYEANHKHLDIKVRYNGVKVHGKMIYIKLKKDVSIGVFSTGNYNSSTALVYKDYHYISCEKNVTEMIHRNFSVLWNSDQPVLSSISNILTNEIYKEIAKGKNGKIWIQTNHLDNKLIVSLLKEAIQRGCDVKLIVRTTRGFHNRELKNCKTVVGKYLEHARLYIFGNENDRRVYLSSSDILFRNLYNRFESYIKITNSEIETRLIDDFRELYKNGQKE